jgi:hypothetical protein
MNEALELLKELWPIAVILVFLVGLIIATRDKKEKKSNNLK